MIQLEILYGTLSLNTFEYASFFKSGVDKVELNGEIVDFEDDGEKIKLVDEITVLEGNTIEIKFK